VLPVGARQVIPVKSLCSLWLQDPNMLKLAIKNRVAGGSQGGSIRSIEKARKENKRNKIELYIYIITIASLNLQA